VAKSSSQLVILPSLLDLLIGETEGEQAVLEAQSLRDLEASVARDLEDLLNTRMEAMDDMPDELPATQASLMTYGLPDFTTVDLTNTPDKRRVQSAIEAAIRRFEPRLTDVRVSLTEDSASTYSRRLGFRIVGTLRVYPRPPESTFDTWLEVASQHYEVRAGL